MALASAGAGAVAVVVASMLPAALGSFSGNTFVAKHVSRC